MFGKFALFFVVALCATQGFHAYSVDPETRAVEDIVAAIKDIIKKVETAIADIVSNIPNLIGNLQEKIKEIIDSIDVGGIIEKIQDKIDAILASAGIDISDARTCVDAEKVEVEKLIKDTTDSITACKKVADERTEALEKELQELKTKAHGLIEEINSGVKQCVKEHGLNPIKLAKCMTDHLGAIKAKADALVKQVADTIATATVTAADITITLAKCTANISKNLIVKQKEIIENFQKCVNDLKQ